MNERRAAALGGGRAAQPASSGLRGEGVLSRQDQWQGDELKAALERRPPESTPLTVLPGGSQLATSARTAESQELRLRSLESRVRELSQARERTATDAERDAWAAQLVRVAQLANSRVISVTQAQCLLDTWQRALELSPNVMYPTIGRTEDQVLYMSWSPAGRSLVLEIQESGVAWFYADASLGDYDGSEELRPKPPPRFFSLLRAFIRA